MNRARFLLLLPSSVLALLRARAEEVPLADLQRKVVAHHARLVHAACADSLHAEVLQQFYLDLNSPEAARRFFRAVPTP